ncbi:MAG: hemerythrin domain-containing protein [Deltaproteobacteria bacterium]|nr:hemerythrin domain-containing protein [Deltaproteobacteria bacterium]
MAEKEQFLYGLEKEHASIVDLLNGLEPVLKSGGVNDVASMVRNLNQLKEILTYHLKNEDRIFYPDMKKRAIELGQDALLSALDVFIEDMHKISKKVFDFFSKYKSGNDIASDKKGFIQGMIDLRDALIKRINTEEKTLYYIYKAYYDI